MSKKAEEKKGILFETNNVAGTGKLGKGGWCENKMKIKHEELGNKLSM